MPGVLGLTYRISELSDEVRAGLAAEIARYKILPALAGLVASH